MAPVEIDTIPRDVMAPLKNMKVVDKALELPLVSSACDEMAKLASPVTPFVESSIGTITPMVEEGIGNIKTKVVESIVPRLPEGMSDKIHTNITTAVDHVTAAVEKIDTLACGGIDQLTEKFPQLQETAPKLMENTKEAATGYMVTLSRYVASFSLVQVMFTFLGTGLDIVEGVVKMTGGTQEGALLSSIKKLRATFCHLGFMKSPEVPDEAVGVKGEVNDSTEEDLDDDADVSTDNEELDEVEEVDECHTPACGKVAHRT